MTDDKSCSEETVTKSISASVLDSFLSLPLYPPPSRTLPLSLCLSQGAFWGLAIGLLVGCIRMLLDFIYPAPLCYEVDDRPAVLKYVHYLYFSVLLSFITLVVVVGVSLVTEEPKPEQVQPLSQICDEAVLYLISTHVDHRQINLFKLMCHVFF